MKPFRIGLLGAAGAVALLATAGNISGQSRDGKDRRLFIFNSSRDTILTHLFAEPSRRMVERLDRKELLGNDKVVPGRPREINLDDGSGECLFDIRAVASDGSEVTYRRLNVCNRPARPPGPPVGIKQAPFCCIIY